MLISEYDIPVKKKKIVLLRFEELESINLYC